MKTFSALWQRAVQRGAALWADEKKRINLLVGAGLAGLLLLAFSEWIPQQDPGETQPAAAAAQSQASYAQELETKLQAVLAKTEGVGSVEVVVTLEQQEETVYVTDQETAADGSATVSHVLPGGSGLVQTVRMPRVLGVAVVCAGGADAAVQNRVVTLVQALTGVGAHHITVAQMAPTQ